MNIRLLTQISEKRRSLMSLLLVLIWCISPGKSGAQQILKDVIVGDDVACPGLTNKYHIDVDIYFPMSIQWRIIEGPGEFVGSDRGQSVELQWKTTDRGHTKLIMFAVSYFPPLGLIDTIDIHVDKDLNRMNLNCRGNVMMDFGMDCTRYISINELITNGKIKCEDDFEFTLELENITVPNPVPKAYNGRTLIATIMHKETGQFCRSNVTLGDFSGPRLYPQNDTVLCSDPRAYDPKNNLFGKPKVIADCNEAYTLKVNEYKYVNVDNDPYIEGYIERIWRATDQNGNRTDARDTVFLRKVVFDQIVCPENVEITCEEVNLLNQPREMGTPTFDGMSIYSEDPYCKVYAGYEDEEVPGCGGSKVVYRTWTITSYEEETPREKTCVQIITVVDVTGPALIFDEREYALENHEDVSGLQSGKAYPTFYKNSIVDNCKAEGDFPVPLFVQDCTPEEDLLVTIRWNQDKVAFNLSEKNPNVRFRNMSIGKYLVEYSAYDDCGNMGRDTIVIVFQDKKPPTLVLNDDLGVFLTGEKSLTWGNVSAFDLGTFDNCALKIVLARRVDWETACDYTANTSVSSAVRDYYDQRSEWVRMQNDDCLSEIVEYGWGDRIPFCCDDVCEDGVLVEFLAIDEFCNYSKLVTRVRVWDNSRPEVQFKLPNITMNCFTYQSLYKEEVDKGNTSVFGSYVARQEDQKTHSIKVFECSNGRMTPYLENRIEVKDGWVKDNCNVQIEEEVNESIGACGEGWIERIFTITNPCDIASGSRNSIQVIQRIFITKDCKLRPEDFRMPYADTTVVNCSLTEVPLRGPELIRDEYCKDLGVTYTDLILRDVEPVSGVCYTIERTWEISDWCESDPYYLPEFVQYIYIKNMDGPKIINARMGDICIDAGCEYLLSRTFGVTDDCTPAAEVKMSWVIERREAAGWKAYRSETGNRISGLVMTTGQYRLTVEAEDKCFNVTKEISEFKVGYCKSLSISGPESITFNLNSQKDQLRLADIPYQVNHPCSAANYEVRIRYAGSGFIGNDGQMLPPDPGAVSLEVSCDKVGKNQIELWIVDQAGNAAYYTLTFVVKDPRGVCPGGDQKLVGSVRNPAGKPLHDVYVSLNGPTSKIRDNITDGNGRFDLGSLSTSGESVRIVPEKSDHPLDGLSAFDALQIYRLATGKKAIESPYEELAADMNEDGVINAFDVLAVQKLLLNKVSRTPGRPWIFINSEMQMEARIQAGQEYRSKLYFTGMKKGDVNFSVGTRSGNRMSGPRQLLLLKAPESKSGLIRIPVTLDQAVDVRSLQLSLQNRNESPWIAVEPGRLRIGSEDYSMTETDLDLVWIQTIMYGPDNAEMEHADFYLVFDADRVSQIDPSKIELSLHLLPEVYADYTLKENIRLEYEKKAASIDPVSAPYPNPFAHVTKFDINGKEMGVLRQVELYDMSGRQVLSRKIGQNVDEYILEGKVFSGAGLYAVRFVFDREVVIRKLYYIP